MPDRVTFGLLFGRDPGAARENLETAAATPL
jgi:hypothetical protein